MDDTPHSLIYVSTNDIDAVFKDNVLFCTLFSIRGVDNSPHSLIYVSTNDKDTVLRDNVHTILYLVQHKGRNS